MIKCDKVERNEKFHYTSDILFEWPHLNGLICSLILILFYIKRKWLMRNLATILSLKSKLSGESQPFNAIHEIIEMLKNSWISKNFIKNCFTIKTFFEAQTARHVTDIIQYSPNPPPPDKILLHLQNKNFLM